MHRPLPVFVLRGMVYLSTMESFVHADIFFVVTTVAVILVAAVLVVVLVYVVRIVRDTEHLIGRIRKEGDEVMDDVHTLRHGMKGAAKRSRLGGLFFTGRKRKRRDSR